MNKEIRNSLITVIAILLLSGCAMNQKLHLPASQGKLEQVKAEIDGGRQVDSRDAAGQTPLMYAAESGQLEVVRYLISAGADVNATSNALGLGTPLIYAASSDRTQVMQYLIDNGARVDARTPARQETALMWAAGRGHVEAANLLIESGADTGLKNKDGQTALDIARETNREPVIELLSR